TLEPVHTSLDALQSMCDRPQPTRQPFDVGGRGNVQCTHCNLLCLRSPLAGVERPPNSPCDQGVFQQVGERLAEPLLRVLSHPVAQILGDVACVRHLCAPDGRGRRARKPRGGLLVPPPRRKDTVQPCPSACSSSCSWSFRGSSDRRAGAPCCAGGLTASPSASS